MKSHFAAVGVNPDRLADAFKSSVIVAGIAGLRATVTS
jgi:hypothetical protein